MSKRSLALCSLLLFAVTVSIFVACSQAGFLSRHETDVYDDLEGRDNRVFLHEDENIRTVEYYADKVTRRHATAIDTNGSTTEFWYWPSGNLKEAITYFPESGSDKGGKKIRRHAKLLKDGITYATDFEFSLDGSMLKSTVLEKSGDRSTRRNYFKNGSVKQEELFSLRPTTPLATWYRLSSLSFHTNGTLSESIEALGIFGSDTKRYDDNGRLLFTSQLSDYATQYRESWFFEDGKTVKRKVFQSSAGTNVKTYASNGILLEERAWYGTVGEGMMNVKFYDSIDGKQVLEQTFMFIGGQYQPYSFTVFEDGAKTLYLLLFSGTPNNIQVATQYHSRFGENGEHTTIVYDKNGYVTREFRNAGGGKKIWLHEYKSSDKVKRDPPVIMPEWTLLRPYISPPKFVKYDPSPYR